MSVDMYERRFRKELQKLPIFEQNDAVDARVRSIGFPAWRALFSSLCLYGHSTGYRLPSFDKFFRYCFGALAVKHPDKAKYAPMFEGEFLPGMTQRISGWYESGMAETYLYACLVEAIEDRSKSGLVIYDPRVDWKMKTDLIVIANGRNMRINAFVGDSANRAAIETNRDLVEQERKKNTLDSAHWDNLELESMPVFQISRTENDMQVVNGVRLFSITAVNALLKELFDATGAKEWYFA